MPGSLLCCPPLQCPVVLADKGYMGAESGREAGVLEPGIALAKGKPWCEAHTQARLILNLNGQVLELQILALYCGY